MNECVHQLSISRHYISNDGNPSIADRILKSIQSELRHKMASTSFTDHVNINDHIGSSILSQATLNGEWCFFSVRVNKYFILFYKIYTVPVCFWHILGLGDSGRFKNKADFQTLTRFSYCQCRLRKVSKPGTDPEIPVFVCVWGVGGVQHVR